jgi:hypothetical protein
VAFDTSIPRMSEHSWKSLLWGSLLFAFQLNADVRTDLTPPVYYINGKAVRTSVLMVSGDFSISDWSEYPSFLPRPIGPFRLLEGEEYDVARRAATLANRALHRANRSFADLEIHETVPVKFGGDPVDPANKIALPQSLHNEATRWWNQLMGWIQRP